MIKTKTEKKKIKVNKSKDGDGTNRELWSVPVIFLCYNELGQSETSPLKGEI